MERHYSKALYIISLLKIKNLLPIIMINSQLDYWDLTSYSTLSPYVIRYLSWGTRPSSSRPSLPCGTTSSLSSSQPSLPLPSWLSSPPCWGLWWPPSYQESTPTTLALPSCFYSVGFKHEIPKSSINISIFHYFYTKTEL